MMGTKVPAFAPVCNRSLEERVPIDNFSRHVEARLDLSFVRGLGQGFVPTAQWSG